MNPDMTGTAIRALQEENPLTQQQRLVKQTGISMVPITLRSFLIASSLF